MTATTLFQRTSGPLGAPTLLLGGSLGSNLDMWRPQLAAFGDQLRVVRFDHRGHGGSPVPPGPYSIEELGRDVLALLDRLGIERASYCGLSLGGMVGMWLAAHAPERIDKLVLICTAAHLPPAESWRARAEQVRTVGMASVADAVLGRWFTPRYRAALPARVSPYRAMIAACPAEGYAGCCEAIAAMDQLADLPRITAPTLVIAGEDDPATPPEHGERIHAGIAGSRLVVLQGAAHLANAEQAEAVSQLILEHVTKEQVT
ncbi:3-oxoadipate enol-lactonase [Dactylosporangium sp. AC04546]|uniref:3-oxoadipate enol-lactonase n=1 Tax=Dactylosporangium sp. AC04546 TaxID=2862460 RepID=UPI001EDE4A22|nr:3-oxoadipate enol-lactonase [Dactylosporangium sp. AC04546]WVK80275.1 3-oxoadipate enol-lactonase [Dactylosporangium sp. AC04546]